NYMYENNKSFSEAQPWTSTDSIIYNFVVKDTNRFYNILLELDHNKKYPFENLYIKLNTHFPNQLQKSDIVSVILADETGEWYSDCRGKTCTFYLPLQEQIIFPQKGKYQIVLYPWMRQDSIRDIYRVGFKVERDGKR
ncbi:MAG: gliding motility lipoprotein GldH, partial [Saprospiraceae bacterium]